VPEESRIRESKAELNLSPSGRDLTILRWGGKANPQLTLLDAHTGITVRPAWSTRCVVWNWTRELPYWIGRSEHGPPIGVHLFRTDEEEPVLILGIDHMPSGGRQFNATGNLFAWSNKDGTVNVCDIPRVQAELKKLGLEW